MLLYIGLAVVLIIGVVYYWRMMTPSSPTLYDRLGGVFAIAKVVDDFSDSILRNPKVGKNSPNEYLRAWSREKAETRLPGLKFMRTLWLCAVSGGPFKYSPTRPGKCPFGLEKAHAELHISSDEFDEVAKILSETLDNHQVPLQEKTEVLNAFAAHKGEVIGMPPNC